MKRKIKITSKQYKLLNSLYRIGGFLFILSLLITYAYFINKLLEFILIFLPYFISKGIYDKQYHSNSLKHCFLISLGVFALATTLVIDKNFSIMFACITGACIAYISYILGDIQFKLKDYSYIEPRYNMLLDEHNDKAKIKPFNTDTCTIGELIKRCQELHFSDQNQNLAIDFFINKTKHSILADRLCIDEKSITTRKKRMKDKLNDL